VRIATYNVEWFANLFDNNDQLRNDGGWSGRWDVTRADQTAAVGQVFQAIDADAVMVIEAPDTGRKRSTITALENFANHFDLRARKALMGFANDTQQEIALLYAPDVLIVQHAPLGVETGPEGATVLRVLTASCASTLISTPPRTRLCSRSHRWNWPSKPLQALSSA
jgi:hypothetical protein